MLQKINQNLNDQSKNNMRSKMKIKREKQKQYEINNNDTIRQNNLLSTIQQFSNIHVFFINNARFQLSLSGA